jgi:predicted RNase H-like HicB family nuclease
LRKIARERLSFLPVWDLLCDPESGRIETEMIDLCYSLTIEATEDPNFFGFYSPELEGFTGVGHSVEDCLYQAKWEMIEHLELLKQNHLPIPPANPDPRVIIENCLG